MRPATTGETEKGRSIRAVSRVRPRKLNLPIAHAAARPKIDVQGNDDRRHRNREADRDPGARRLDRRFGETALLAEGQRRVIGRLRAERRRTNRRSSPLANA